MPDKTLKVLLQMKYDTKNNWDTINPVLEKGELGIESDTNTIKVGDGKTAWTQLQSAGGADLAVLQPFFDAKVDKEENKSLLADSVKNRFEEAYSEKHTHDNNDILDRLTDDNGVLKYNGNDIASSSALTADQLQTLANADAHALNVTNPHETTLTKLSDVNITTKKDGQVVAWSDGEQKFVVGDYGVSISESGTWVINGADTNIAVSDTTGRIRLEPGKQQAYIKEVLDTSMQVVNDKLAVIGINGLKTPIAQLNFIQGLDQPIMNYVAAIKGGMEFKTTLENDAELATIVAPKAGDTYIVKNSEQADGSQVTYVYSAEDAKFLSLGETDIQLRDFLVEPIDLQREVTGILPKERIEGYHTHTNLLDVLEELSVAGDDLLFKGKILGGTAGGTVAPAGTTNYNLLENRPQINGVTLIGNKTPNQLGLNTILMSKEDFVSEQNPGSVKTADSAKNIDIFVNGDKRVQPYMYYGTNISNQLGIHVLPINANDKSAIQQRVFEGVLAGDNIAIGSLTEIDNKAMIQCYEEVSGEENVEETIKSYNINTQQAFYCSPAILFTETHAGLSGAKSVKGEYDENDGVHIYDASEFKTITSATEVI